MRRVFLAPVLLGFAAFVGCSTIQSLSSLAGLGMSDEDLNKAAAEAFEDLKKKETIETNAYINRYVKCVANNIVEVTQDPTGVKQWEVVVFRNNAVNAFALPGGKIGVYTGLLSVAKNQNQLAAVIGHEVGHVIKEHGKARMQMSQIANVALETAGMSTDNAMVIQAVGLGAQYGILLPFSRSHESEADEVGLKLMAMAGFDPQESVKLWQNMAAMGGDKPPEMMSTHPSDQTRIKDLQANMPDALALSQVARGQGRNPSCQ
ncbi:MAG: M48 family metallopeptidase [Leptospiraceae bacterium]|nr:M48 family metallopeptidase [Leptospiraceae bacterium]